MATSILPAAERLLESRRTPAFAERDLDITRLYRAFITPVDWGRPELTVFVAAGTREAAIRKIAGVIALLEYRKPDEITERIYNLASAEELIAENVSDDHALRLFETGWSGGRPTHFVRSPLVLLPDPGPLLRIWAAIPQVAQ